MTRKEIAYCNKCKKEIGERLLHDRITFFRERVTDAAGGMENMYYFGDLCQKCQLQAINYLLDCKNDDIANNNRQQFRDDFAQWMKAETG